ncbi:NACHT, LRR and PYD domains-containing protein 12-like [Pseudophryne corroboree]|uniref:NACHT, LRR and PYD domains-containing protein 12-like n=1 Tax=Pseudophryne corroboree TaxID=495146 RepID=UPI00308173A6
MATSSLLRARCERSRTPGDILCDALEDLIQYDFQRFKDRLSEFPNRRQSLIPRGRLEDAHCVTTKNLPIDAYGEEAALDVTIKVFKLINLMGPAEALHRRVTQHGCRLKCMRHIQNRYHLIEDYNARLGESTKLKKRFTTLLYIKIHRDEEERQHEITASGQRHLQMMANRASDKYSPTTIQILFDPEEDGVVSNIVVLQGPAGIGKTMTCQKIMLDWASGDLYKNKFQFAFYINCREVSTITGKISLAGYLSSFCGLKCPSDLLQSIFLNSEGILFIVDGFDELKWSSTNDMEVCDDPFQEISKEILLNSLFRKKLLWDCSLIITTRPFSWMKLKNLLEYPQYVEILGFTGLYREEYFYNFFERKEQAYLAFSTVKDNDTLLTLCVVPLTCWILCTVMKQLLKEGSLIIECKTSTSIYLLYLKTLIDFHRRNSAQSTNTCIQKLCALAIEGVWDQRTLFEESDLVRHGLSVSELESVFLSENIFQREVGTYTCYSFIHLSVQEFFAALYYVLDKKSVNTIVDFEIRKVKDLLEASEDQPHLTVTILCCLYETQDEDFVKSMMSHFPFVEIKGFLNVIKKDQENFSCWAVAYCLERSTIGHSVYLELYTIGPKARMVLSKALSKCSQLCFKTCGFPDTEDDIDESETSLSGLFKDCQMDELLFLDCALTSSCCNDLRSVITTNRSLTTLALSRNALEDSGIKLLSEGLRSSACAIEEVCFDGCGLTSSSCNDLCSVLIANRSLTRLDLSENNLRDYGVKLLCQGLRHPACTLEELRLRCCGLTSSCCDDLHSVLITNHSLTRLELSWNILEDRGFKRLLQHCALTSSCCNDLRSVLITNRSLTRLELAWNKLMDSGVKLLCEGLMHPDCTLEELMLKFCGLTSSCCDDLRSVLITNRSLISLNMSWNHLQNNGIKLLCEGLKHPNCTLLELK